MSADFADYRDRRLAKVKPSTVRRELAMMSHVVEVAFKEWGVGANLNLLTQIRMPPSGEPRTRRLGPPEFTKLMSAAQGARNSDVPAIVELAIETGMRRGEVLNLSWDRIDLARGMVHLP